MGLRVGPAPVGASLASSDYDAEANLQRLFPARRPSPEPPAPPARSSPPRARRAERPDPSGLGHVGTPRTRKLDTGAGASGAGANNVEGAGGPLGPGRFERWGRGRSTLSSAERGRLPIAPPPAAEPPADDDSSVRLLATAAAAAGVVPALAPPAAQAGAGGLSTFQSSSVRLAVTVAEQLDSAERAAAGAPSARSVAVCLHLLGEMAPLLGPLEEVTVRLTQALRCCLLSDRHYSLDGDGRSALDAAPLTYFELVSRLEEGLGHAQRSGEAARVEGQQREASVVELQKQLQEVQTALHTQRDQMEREKQHRGHHDRDISLHRAEASAAEHKHAVLQAEAVAQHREQMQIIIALEEKVELLAKENAHLRNAITTGSGANATADADADAAPSSPTPTPRRQ